MYPQSMFRAKIRKNITIFHLKIIIFTAVKYHCILHGHVFVMYLRTLTGSFVNRYTFSIEKEFISVQQITCLNLKRLKLCSEDKVFCNAQVSVTF